MFDRSARVYDLIYDAVKAPAPSSADLVIKHSHRR
jgi:hypothetical protein